jgi:protein-L-isoaspartate(D-aspartate) O-methyltransferase
MGTQSIVDFYRRLDRSFFIDNENKRWSGLDEALPIGFGQTISQPSLVLAMTCQLDPQISDRILEIGTGSGYQTALLAEFAGEVFTVERIGELARRARERLDQLGFANIHYRVGDGSLGWPEEGPFDKIMVTAAASKMPVELTEQLGPGGRMIIPVGSPGFQDLLLVTRDPEGQVHERSIEKVVFVELKGRYGWSGF